MALSADERASIEDELVKTKAMASGVVETIAAVNDVMAELRDQSYETIAEIRSAADLLILEVRSHEEKLVEKVREILEWKEASLQLQKKTLEDLLAELQQSIDYTSDILNKPDNEDIDEWKSAICAQLQCLQNMKDDYISKPDVNGGIGFVFLYEDEQFLKSIASYGSVEDNVKEGFDRKDKNSKGMSRIPVIPVITLNGLIVDLAEEEKKSYIDSDTDSSDDDDDDESDDESDEDEENATGSSDDDDNDDDNDDNHNEDISITKGRQTVRKSNDDYVNAKNSERDDASDNRTKHDEKNGSDKQKIGKAMVNSNTNKRQKLSTLL